MRTRTLSTALALLVALSVLGAAVAMWYDTLKIKATVETGEVDVEFGEVTCEELAEYDKEWVADCTVEFGDIEYEDQNNPTGNNDKDLVITIKNAYPGYTFKLCIEVINTGTIPVKGPYLVPPAPTPPTWLGVLSHNIAVVQIDPGESYTFCAEIVVLQTAPESTTVTGQVKVRFIQWNEA